ncbi:uncharacterized protein LOC143613680 [Bidens hawaiensis]|uniref:uncharacterized protein LOC143613680 n=1 Tax=Bidens hawaiensis TaxID=980011 RepID=UPI00404AF1EC
MSPWRYRLHRFRASDCEPDAAALTAVATLERGSKRSTKHKAPKKEIFSTSLIKELDNINTEDIEFTLKQEPEVKLPERRKKVKKSAAKIKNETLVTPMRADDNPVGDVSSTVLAPISDENIAVKNEVLETTLVDDIKKNDEMIVKMEVSEPSKSHRNRARVENMDEISKSKLKDGSRRRKKDVEKTGLKIDETVVKQPDDVATSMDDCARNDDILMNNDVLIEVKVEDIDDIKTEKQNEMMNVVKKSTRKKKTKKSASRNEDESMTKHVKVEISDNKSQSIDHEDISKNKNASEVSKVDNKVGDEEKKNSLTGTQDQLSKLQPTKVELESKKSQSVDHGDHLEETSKNVTVAEVSKVNDEVDITNDGSRELKFMDHFAPGDQPNKTASVDNQKATEKPKKEIKDGSMNDGEKIISTNEGLVKVKKNNKSSLTGQHDRVSKLQSAETKLEINKSQSTDHHHDPEDTSQNKAGSHEINFMDYFAPSHQPNKTASIDNRKDTKKPKKIISKNKNNKVVTSPNIPNVNQIKTPKTTRNIDAESSSSSQSFRISFHNQKNNKQPSVVGPVKKVLPAVHNWLKTPAKIFGDYDSDKSSANDNATVNSDSTRRTPSRNPSSSSSSSGDSATSIYLKRNRSNAMKRKEDGGKNSMMSQSNLKKNMSMSDLLRSSSRFKKAKFTASQTEDTESQPVDFVSDSQPLA